MDDADVHSTPNINSTVTLEDVMRQVCSNGHVLTELKQEIREVRGAIHKLQVESKNLKKKVKEKKEEELKSQVAEAMYAVNLAVYYANDSVQYNRHNNLRIYGLPEMGERRGGDEDGEGSAPTPTLLPLPSSSRP